MDLTDPQQINAYTYSNNNPLTFSDPSGLFCDGCGAGGDSTLWTPDNGPGCTHYNCYDQDGGVDYPVRPGGGGTNSTASPSTTIDVTQKDGVVSIENDRVLTANELAAMYPQYDESQRMKVRAESKCDAMDGSEPLPTSSGALTWIAPG